MVVWVWWALGSPRLVVWACILCGSMALFVLVLLLACRPLAFNGKLFYLNHSFVSYASQVQAQAPQTVDYGICTGIGDNRYTRPFSAPWSRAGTSRRERTSLPPLRLPVYLEGQYFARAVAHIVRGYGAGGRGLV